MSATPKPAKMALKTLSSFSIFPPNSTSDRRPATQIRVSVSHGDDDRYESTRSASDTNEPANPTSKPSKNPNPKFSHPAFRRISRVSRRDSRVTGDIGNGVSVGDDGVSYRIPDAPFEFQYSYTETPKVKPLALREPPFVPFGPSTMPRPWTGRAPLPPSKKKLPEFDSFRLPPPHKKGVKSVQAPGPYLAGSGPKYVKSREEILGEPLTGEEITELVRGNLKTRKQLNMGRDGLTHNMLDNIHAHWKRRRVCKIKCIGVCTVDMDNVRQQLEEKTGGKIIYSRGGVLFLFRGRNYNYKTRPRFPIMLWKPVTPVYPRLVQQVPEGLTLEEASEMRKRGRKLSPICKLGKNGVYSHLVKHVREAFEVCELVRINCKGMNGSDYKKIGGKLKDLVPCVLISFEYEHILMWRGRDWKSSLPKPEDGLDEASESTKDDATANSLYTTNTAVLVGRQETIEVDASKSLNRDESPEDVRLEDISHPERNDQLLTDPYMCPSSINSNGSASSLNSIESTDELSAISEWTGHLGLVTASDSTITHNDLSDASGGQKSLREPALPPESIHSQSSTMSSGICTEGVLLLWRQAIESGSALVLDDASLDANIVYERAVALAKAAPPGPVFRHRIRKVVVQKGEKQKYLDVEVVAVSEKRSIPKNSRNQRGKDFTEAYPDVVSHGSLRVDELAKLLA